MGNNSSKAGPASQSSSPSPAGQKERDDSSVPTRRAPKRRESVNLHPGAKTSAASPSASVESAAGQLSSQSRAPKSLSRGRSNTDSNNAQKPQDAATESEDTNSLSRFATATSRTTTRSISPSQPVDVPQPSSVNSSGNNAPSLGAPPGQSPANYYLPNSQFNRPPRLPLPIEEEVLQPGSPIISPTDVTSPIHQNDADIPRRTSMLSSTTADDDDLGEDFSAHDVADGPRVEKLIEWKQGGDKVYVTGTFANWNRKFRLHKNGPSKDPNALSAMVQFPVGTHHLRFLVDNVMTAANTMPTAVDYTNVLVNYIEVTPDELHKKPAIPKDIPQPTGEKTTLVERQKLHIGQSPQTHAASPTRDVKRVGTPSAVPGSPSRATSNRASPATHHAPPAPTPVKKQPEVQYTPDIPRYLLDLDAAEESSRFQRANAVMNTQPQPPSLPLFLSKSILNGTTPMKDDSSVLIMPNHTVLNHLATSSIKNNVLATSATTRYKRKYVTTIMYKPTSEVGE